MGNSCCRADSPCATAEEKSGLLSDESKAMSNSVKKTGACGPEGSDERSQSPEEEASKVPVQQCPDNEDTEPNNTQENGPFQNKGLQEAAPSPSKMPENSTPAQDEETKVIPAEGDRAENLQCTLNSQQKDPPTTDAAGIVALNAEPKKEEPTLVQDETPNAVVIPSLPEKATPEPTAANATVDEVSKEVIASAAKPSEESAQSDEGSSVPSCQPTAAAGGAASISAATEETAPDTLSCTPSEDLNTCSSSVRGEDDASEDAKSHNVSQICFGSGEEEEEEKEKQEEDLHSVMELEATSPTDSKDSSKSGQDTQPHPECSSSACSDQEVSSEKSKQDAEEEEPLQAPDEGVLEAEKDEEIQEEDEETEHGQAEPQEEVTADEEQLEGSSHSKAEAGPAAEKEADLGSSEEDLYRGAEELSSSVGSSDLEIFKLEERCSLSPAVDVLFYSEREWKGNTAKSALIKKGYKEMSQKFSSLRRVRGDNYCALRATLFQVLSQSTHLPAWLQEDDATMLPEKLDSLEGLINQWRFPGDVTGDASQQLRGYLELLRKTWRAAVDCASVAERQQLCERVFQCGEEELGLLEALKLLMLGRAVELHGRMQRGDEDVPLFCWLLFARDSSDCPRSFLSNHLRHVGLTAGLEQVEMFLLGYALQCTIQVFRLYKADTEEFVTYYPDDHKDDWQTVCLVTEDDRHYNVPVVKAAEPQEELASR
uniref:OTU deubiquitinase with linear linkage specificity a n=1 Tax=Oryzias latipes TaxID=8090 RepID=A0A3P9KGH1_ORYLA